MNVFAAPPAVSSFMPVSASSGMTVQITGTDLLNTTAVRFGGTPALSFTILSATRVNAVVALGSSGAVEVTTNEGVASRNGFSYVPTSGIITDFGGFWKTSGGAVNPVMPDNSHNLLSFTYNDSTFSTGVNDALLTSNGVNFYPGIFRALPVAAIGGNTSTGSSIFIALAKRVDGSFNVGNASTVAHYNVMKALTDGINGLDLGTGITNLPASAQMSFKIVNINAAAISDATPDIILTQIASPSIGNDEFSFIDVNGNTVGVPKTQDMTLLPSLGEYHVDLFNLTPNVAYNKAKVYSFGNMGSREIRVTAFRLSDFGITASNASQVVALKIAPSSNSDYAFIGYNANSINLPPNVARNDAGTAETICAGGTGVLEVIGSASGGGALSYSWEEMPSGSSTWSIVTASAKYSGVNTERLVINNADNGARYRARITEAGNVNIALSPLFTITVAAPAPPTSASVTGGSTVCLNTPVQLTSTVNGGSTRFYQWQKNISGTFQDIDGANLSSYSPEVNQTGTSTYRVLVTGASGCPGGATSNNSNVVVTGISSVTPAEVCVGAPVTLAATATSGTIDWFANDAGGTALATADNYSPSGLSASRTYYVASSGCAAATVLRVPVPATVHSTTVGGNIAGGGEVAPGNNSSTLTLNSFNGSVLKWQSSTDNFNASITDIANATPSLTVTNLNEDHQFRALVRNGTCASTYSNAGSVTMYVTLSFNERSVRVNSENNGVVIRWSVSNSVGVKHYEVERSADGTNFNVVAKTSVSGNNDYQATDKLPLENISFYRVKEVNVDGKVVYTETVRFVNSGSKASFNIYPNPVADHQANISLNGYTAGSYTFRLISATGQVVLEKNLQYSGGAVRQTLQLPKQIVPGKYTAQISGKTGVQNFSVVVL
ncbi:MAG: T9SS type A sorting domain-containing protein [Flavitalea sp.]